ncbi:MAG: DUF4838 domain-containing protein [Bacteroidaceae bacterium]|nr:DUF4838 domain-containing protein [Bacteroidaceae bacterium]
MYAKKLFYIAVSGAMMAMLTACTGHDLFQKGRSEYSIVISDEAPETERYAAQELQHWIAQVSGVELPITGLDGGKEGKRLIVGFNPLVEKLMPGKEKPGERDDAFTWCNKGGDLLFWGGSKRGTLYSVYSFLEEELGCRWYSSEASVAPKRDSYQFNMLFRHEEPGIMIRDNCYLDVRENATFSARMRNNFVRLPRPDGAQGLSKGSAEGYWGVHAMGYFISPNEYYKEHPEYFSLIDGKRQSDYAQLCLSNPEVLSICIQKVKDVMRREPDFLIYSMEQNDNVRPCQCKACQELVNSYGGETGIMVWFENQVADAVKDEFPDKFIGTFAYQYTRHAPKDIKPRENVVIRLCSIECCMLHPYNACEQNLSFQKDLEDWGVLAPHLYIWDYTTDFLLYCTPTPNWWALQSHIQAYRDNHAIGIMEEGDYQTVSCELRELHAWLLSKLLWNPDADVEALILDFTDGFYGAAGPYIRQYLDLEKRILLREGMHTGCYASIWHEMFTDEFITEGRRLMTEAKKAVSGDELLTARVEKEEVALCLLQMERMPLQGIDSGADELFTLLVKKFGIRKMTEFRPQFDVDYWVERFARIRQKLHDAPLMSAQDLQAGDKGVKWTRYEGSFKTTAQMLAQGKVAAQGTRPGIGIDETDEVDHFGYVFKTNVKVETEGLYELRLRSDDGCLVIVDGQTVLDNDGSHSATSCNDFIRLAKGMHSIEIRYFDNHEEQCLEVFVSTPEGYNGPLPESNLYLPE